jgi:hypothetical protein
VASTHTPIPIVRAAAAAVKQSTEHELHLESTDFKKHEHIIDHASDTHGPHPIHSEVNPATATPQRPIAAPLQSIPTASTSSHANSATHHSPELSALNQPVSSPHAITTTNAESGHIEAAGHILKATDTGAITGHAVSASQETTSISSDELKAASLPIADHILSTPERSALADHVISTPVKSQDIHEHIEEIALDVKITDKGELIVPEAAISAHVINTTETNIIPTHVVKTPQERLNELRQGNAELKSMLKDQSAHLASMNNPQVKAQLAKSLLAARNAGSSTNGSAVAKQRITLSADAIKKIAQSKLMAQDLQARLGHLEKTASTPKK